MHMSLLLYAYDVTAICIVRVISSTTINNAKDEHTDVTPGTVTGS